MRVEYRIDWLTLVDRDVTGLAQYLNFPPHEMIRLNKGFLGYLYQYKHQPTGAIMACHPDRSDMGTLWQFSGSAIAALEKQLNLASLPALLAMGTGGRRATRVDCTIDVFDFALPLEELIPECVAYNLSNKKAQFTVIQKPGIAEGTTIYRFRREYRKFLRLYDRAAKHGGEPGVTRIEAEIKSPLAQELWKTLSSIGQPYDPREDIASVCQSCADFKHPAWTELFRYSDKWNTSVPQSDEESDLLKWLEKQVAPTLWRSIIGEAPSGLISGLLKAALAPLGAIEGVQDFLALITDGENQLNEIARHIT
jgi:hypothetical protein